MFPHFHKHLGALATNIGEILRPGQKIESLRIHVVNVPVRAVHSHGSGDVAAIRSAILEVRTDGGLAGWGEASPWPVFTGTVEGNAAALHVHLRPHLLGADAVQVEKHLGDGRCGGGRLPGGQGGPRDGAPRHRRTDGGPPDCRARRRSPPGGGAAELLGRQPGLRRGPRRRCPPLRGRSPPVQAEDRLRRARLRPDAPREAPRAVWRCLEPSRRLQPGAPGDRRHPYPAGPRILRPHLHRAAGQAPRAGRPRGDHAGHRHPDHGRRVRLRRP